MREEEPVWVLALPEEDAGFAGAFSSKKQKFGEDRKAMLFVTPRMLSSPWVAGPTQGNEGGTVICPVDGQNRCHHVGSDVSCFASRLNVVHFVHCFLVV